MAILDDRIEVISPVDGRVLLRRPLPSPAEIDAVLTAAAAARRGWRHTPLAERISAVRAMVDAFVARKATLAEELTLQMGRPIKWAPYEVGGFADRAGVMLDLAPEALADIVPPEKDGFTRFIQRAPHGVVLVLSPWNYPLLTAVNAIVPALVAGNTVVLKHSDQTPLCAERLAEAAQAAGLPAGVFQVLHASHPQVARMVADPRVDYVAFTGSVEGGRAVQKACGDRFIPVGLELGGKDPAYVRQDADLAFAAENIVEGVLFNSGQSCCAIERIYVHAAVWSDFVEAAVAAAEGWVLGDPRDPATTLGPVVRAESAASIRQKVEAALSAGAWGLVDPAPYAEALAAGPQYVAPQLLVGLGAEDALLREETFGPVCGIVKVSGDAEALARMNDSRYGLTASIWTRDLAAARRLGEDLDTGTVFANRCDYLDPHLTWTGVKDSGRGGTLSRLGYEFLTRPRSFHLRHRG